MPYQNFGTFDLSDVYRDVESIKGARLKNRIGGMQVNQMEEQAANQKKKDEINRMYDEMPARIEQYRVQGFNQEADDLQDQYIKGKTAAYTLLKHERELLTKDNWAEKRSRYIQSGLIKPYDMPTKYDGDWLKAKEKKAKADYKIVTTRFTDSKTGKTMAEDRPVISGVPGEARTPYDPYAPKDGAGAGREIKAADSNAIGRATGQLFGGFYDPQSGKITGLSKDEEQRVLSIIEEAERLFLDNPTLGHRQAVAKAARTAGIDIKSLSRPANDPLGIR